MPGREVDKPRRQNKKYDMQQIIDIFLSRPIYMIIAAALLLFLLLGVIKKILKLVAVVILSAALFIGYLYYSGKGVPETPAELGRAAIESGKEGVEKAKELGDKVQDFLKRPEPVSDIKDVKATE